MILHVQKDSLMPAITYFLFIFKNLTYLNKYEDKCFENTVVKGENDSNQKKKKKKNPHSFCTFFTQVNKMRLVWFEGTLMHLFM